MTIYTVHFVDGGKVTMPVAAMSTEEFRLANGGKTNRALLLAQVGREHPGREVVKIVRALTGDVVWENTELETAGFGS